MHAARHTGGPNEVARDGGAIKELDITITAIESADLIMVDALGNPSARSFLRTRRQWSQRFFACSLRNRSSARID